MPKGRPESAPASEQRFPYRDAGPRALGEVVIAHDALLVAVVREHLPRRHRREFDDVLQTCRLHLLADLPKFDSSRGRLQGFVAGTVQATVLDQVRRLERKTLPDALDDDYDPAAPAVALEIGALAERINAAPQDYLTERQTTIYNYLVRGLTRAQIADELGITPDSVSKAITRLRISLVQLVH